MNLRLFRQRSGFTLIELLIVVVIIGILATMGLVGYANAMRNARNSKSISNLNSLQAAFEQYYTSTGGTYAACSTMAASIQGGIPSQPTGAPAYTGTSGCSAAGYCICAPLEPAAGATTVRGGNSGADCAFVSGTSATHYCIQQKQL